MATEKAIRHHLRGVVTGCDQPIAAAVHSGDLADGVDVGIDCPAAVVDQDSATLTDCAVAFCQAVKAAGYTPGVYFYRNTGKNRLFFKEFALGQELQTFPHEQPDVLPQFRQR